MIDSVGLSRNDIDKRLLGGDGLKLFYFLKPLNWNINLKIKINFKYCQKMFSNSLEAQYLVKIEPGCLLSNK